MFSQKEYDKKYREEHKDEIKKSWKLYYEKNREREKERVKQYQINNPEKTREAQKNYCAKKYKTDLKFKLNSRMANTIKKALKRNKNGRHWEDLVGYTLNDLIKRLKSTMPEGYAWQDYIEGKLHIDHIIPISVFNYDKPEHIDFQKCWALKNLRLLPAKENLIKNNKIIKPFQSALKIECSFNY